MSGEASYPTITIPLQQWGEVGHKVAQLEQLHEQQRVILHAVVDALHAVDPNETGKP